MVHLAKEMLHHLDAQPIFGGDLWEITSAIQVRKPLFECNKGTRDL